MKISKKHIFSTLLVSVFVLPIAVFPSESGQVLGINDVKDESLLENVSNSDARGIASGARDVVSTELKDTNQPFFGQGLWDSQQKVKVSTSKFSSGSLVKVTFNGKTTEFLVEGQRNDLSQDTLLIFNTEAFVEIGANPETDSVVNIEALLVE